MSNTELRLDAVFENVSSLNIDLIENPNIQAEFGNVYMVEGNSHVLYALTDTWNSQPQLISQRGYIYIYADYKQDSQERNIAAFKIGDGSSYLIDLPVIQETFYNHIENQLIHITQAEREFWNNKVTCYEEGHSVIFTKENKGE